MSAQICTVSALPVSDEIDLLSVWVVLFTSVGVIVLCFVVEFLILGILIGVRRRVLAGRLQLYHDGQSLPAQEKKTVEMVKFSHVQAMEEVCNNKEENDCTEIERLVSLLHVITHALCSSTFFLILVHTCIHDEPYTKHYFSH